MVRMRDPSPRARPTKSRSTITPPSRSPDKIRSTVTPPSSTSQQHFYSSHKVASTTGTGTGNSSSGQTPPGGENPKSEYDDVPGENETLVPLRKPAAPLYKSSPGNRLFPSNNLFSI